MRDGAEGGWMVPRDTVPHLFLQQKLAYVRENHSPNAEACLQGSVASEV